MKITQSKLSFADISAGDKVKIVAECVDFNFFYGETGVVIRNPHTYLGINVKFDKPRHFRDGTIQTDFNFNPTDLELVDKRPSEVEVNKESEKTINNDSIHEMYTYTTREYYPDEVLKSLEKEAKMILGARLIDKIIELQGDRHVRVFIKQEVRSDNVFIPGDTLNTIHYYVYEPDKKKAELREKITDLQAKITDLLSVNAELVEAIELGMEDEGVDFLERLRKRKKWKEEQP